MSSPHGLLVAMHDNFVPRPIFVAERDFVSAKLIFKEVVDGLNYGS